MLTNSMATKTAMTWNEFSRLGTAKLLSDTKRMALKHPTRIPIFVAFNDDIFPTQTQVEKKHKTVQTTRIKQKYLVHRDLSFGQLTYIIRKKIALAPKQALFGFICTSANEVALLPPTSELLSTLADLYTDKDTGFMIVKYSCENTFGDEALTYSTSVPPITHSTKYHNNRKSR